MKKFIYLMAMVCTLGFFTADKDEAFFSYNRESKKVKEWYKLNFENEIGRAHV